MQEKISLYEELLEMDPGSRLFLPLARLYLEREDLSRAETTLKTGLTRYPEHFEARLFLHYILYQQGKEEEAMEHLQMVSEVLCKFPAFWQHWGENMETRGQRNTAVAACFLARNLQGEKLGWLDVLQDGVRTWQEKGGAQSYTPKQGETAHDLWDTEEMEDEGGQEQLRAAREDPYRTRTMADILSSQGDYAQALDIYTELLDKASSPDQEEKLQERINWVQEKLRSMSTEREERVYEGPSPRKGRRRLAHKLERLAERLEARQG